VDFLRDALLGALKDKAACARQMEMLQQYAAILRRRLAVMDDFVQGVERAHNAGRPVLPPFVAPALPDGLAVESGSSRSDGGWEGAAMVDAADAVSLAHLHDLHRRLRPASSSSSDGPPLDTSFTLGGGAGAEALALAYEVDETAAMIAQHLAALDALQVALAPTILFSLFSPLTCSSLLPLLA